MRRFCILVDPACVLKTDMLRAGSLYRAQIISRIYIHIRIRVRTHGDSPTSLPRNRAMFLALTHAYGYAHTYGHMHGDGALKRSGAGVISLASCLDKQCIMHGVSTDCDWSCRLDYMHDKFLPRTKLRATLQRRCVTILVSVQASGTTDERLMAAVRLLGLSYGISCEVRD